MLPLAHRTRALMLVGLLGAAGCTDSVVLGGECRPLGAYCGKPGHSDDGFDAHVSTDAGRDAGTARTDAGKPPPQPPPDAASELDASVTSDAAVAGPPLAPLPAIQNLSLELTGGPATGGTLGGRSGTTVEPWSWCGGTVDIKTADDTLRPSDGMSFAKLSLAGGRGTLVQVLSTPMAKGTTYALAIDVAASTDVSNAKLTIASESIACFAGQGLGVTPALPADMAFHTYCFVFTPSASINQLMLQATANIGSGGGAIYVDNLREARDCTPVTNP